MSDKKMARDIGNTLDKVMGDVSVSVSGSTVVVDTFCGVYNVNCSNGKATVEYTNGQLGIEYLFPDKYPGAFAAAWALTNHWNHKVKK